MALLNSPEIQKTPKLFQNLLMIFISRRRLLVKYELIFKKMLYLYIFDKVKVLRKDKIH